MDNYHNLVHKIALVFNYKIDENAPDWFHPVLHFVIFIAPIFLIIIVTYLIIKSVADYFRKKSATPKVAYIGYIRGLDKNLFRFVFNTSKKQQIILFIASLLAMPILYGTLELPKQIINNALDSNHFPFTYREYEFSQVNSLLVLCGLYLLAIIVNGLHKYWLNICKGRVAERFLRRLRLLIYRQWRDDKSANRKTDIIPILSQEVEPIGGFAADILTLPVFQIGTFMTIMTFMIVQDPILGAAALAVLPIQLVLLPRFQKYVNILARERIQEVRSLGSKLGNQLDGTMSSTREIYDVSVNLRELERIRREIHRVKFFIKVFNNFLMSLTPFFFYALGGYFVIEDRITLGALVAVLAAHKDMAAPIKELFRYYQALEDVRVRYREIFKFFPEKLKLQN